ncbi:MAG: putative porin [Verrucomicrobia bacterium]|nr:putative porin [Verrucomicrobiota bacterium]
MKPNKLDRTRRWTQLAAGLVSLAGLSLESWGQTADALIDKLVEKGILTVKEANELREETDKGFTQAYQVKTGLPDWVRSMKFNGDLRGRFEGFYAESSDFATRQRLRYRLRAGFTAVMRDNFEVGFRLTSSEGAGGFSEGDPISGNQTFGNNASKKFVFIDLAYAKWAAVNRPDWGATFTLGKMENPFVFPSTILFDRDYTPEGLASAFDFQLGASQTLRLAGAGFALDELSGSGQDPYLLGGQARLDSKWAAMLSSSFGLGYLTILNEAALTTANVPNIGRGNTRTAAGALVHEYTPVYADASLSYTLEKFPGYNAAFPITLSGDFLHNTGASDANRGYSVGVTFGKAGKRGLWDLGYRWTELQRDAWYEEFTESDFGAFYQTAPIGGGTGYASGTNVRGHWVKGSYSPFDSLTFSLAYFLTDLITESPAGSKSGMGRLQVDAVWKF